MFNHQATTPHPLGLSVGATNLAGTCGGHTAVMRPSEVTLNGQRLTGFVDRIGDPVPLVAPDGSHHRPELLLAEALGAVAQSATQGVPAAEVAVAVPAHWRPGVVEALRRTLHDGMPVVSEATAALTALGADPGLPGRGVVALCDFGGSGTSITLADAASNYAPIGETVRFADFSGDLIDQALLTQVAASFGSDVDQFGTAMVGSLARLRAECRAAKERLSAETATAVVVDVPGDRADIRVTRAELEGLMVGPFTDFLAALDDTLQRYHVPTAAVSAVATIGGGARIPLVTQLLSEHLRVPVVTTPRPQLTAAQGAALIAQRSRIVDTATTLAPAAAADPLTATFDAGAPSSEFRALAWSQDEDADADLLFIPADTDYHHQPSEFRPGLHFQHDELENTEPPRRTPLVLFGLAAAAAVITTAVFGVMQLSDNTATPVEAATTVAPSQAPAAPADTPAPPAPQAPPLTTVVVQPAQRANPAPRQQASAHQVPPAPPVTAAPTTAPPTTTPPTTTPPTTTPPSTPPSSPPPPPIDPGPGDGGGTAPAPPPIDPGPGDGGTTSETPPIDPGPGDGSS